MCLKACWHTTKETLAAVSGSRLLSAYKVLTINGRAPMYPEYVYRPGVWMTADGPSPYKHKYMPPAHPTGYVNVERTNVGCPHMPDAGYLVLGGVLHAYANKDDAIRVMTNELLSVPRERARVVRVLYAAPSIVAVSCSAEGMRHIALKTLHIEPSDWTAAGLVLV